MHVVSGRVKLQRREETMRRQFASICACAILLLLNINGSAAQQDQRRTFRPMAPPTLQIKPSLKVILYKLTCQAQGTPVEFPNDIVITNDGPGAVPNGTKIHWEIAAPHYEGSYTLPALPMGQHVFLNGVAGAGVPAGTPCTVTAQK